MQIGNELGIKCVHTFQYCAARGEIGVYINLRPQQRLNTEDRHWKILIRACRL